MKRLFFILIISTCLFACKKDSDSSSTDKNAIPDTTIIELVNGSYPKDGDTILLPKSGGSVNITFIAKSDADTKVEYSLNSGFTEGNIHWHFVPGNMTGDHYTGAQLQLTQQDLIKSSVFWWRITVPNTTYSTGIRHFYVKTY